MSEYSSTRISYSCDIYVTNCLSQCLWLHSFLQLGPRLSLQLVKIEGGLCGGEVLHHEFGELLGSTLPYT